MRKYTQRWSACVCVCEAVGAIISSSVTWNGGGGWQEGQRDRRDNRLSDSDKLSSNGLACPTTPFFDSTYLVDSFTGSGLETWIRRSKHWQLL